MYVYMFMQNLTVCIVHPSLTEKELDNFFCSVSTKRRKWTIEEETMLKNVCAAHGKTPCREMCQQLLDKNRDQFQNRSKDEVQAKCRRLIHKYFK